MSGSNSDTESNSVQRDSILEQFKNVTGKAFSLLILMFSNVYQYLF